MTPEKFLEIKGQQLFYRVEGEGKPVVLIHGFAEDGTIFQKQVEFLKNNYRLIVPDLPGSGRSPLINAAWTMDDYAGCIKLLLEAENIHEICIIGHSMGGYIALAFAEKYSETMSGLGLFHSTAYADNDEKKSTRIKGIEFIQKHGAAKFLEQSIPNLFCEEFKNNHPQKVQEILQRYTNFSPLSLVHYYQSMMQRPDRTQTLRIFKKPVLFIIGEHDTAVPLQQSLELCHLPELSYIHLCKHSGHMGMIEETEKCNMAINAFLQNL